MGACVITEKDVENRLKFYRVLESNSLVFLDRVVRSQEKESIMLVKIRRMGVNELHKNELNLLIFP